MAGGQITQSSDSLGKGGAHAVALVHDDALPGDAAQGSAIAGQGFVSGDHNLSLHHLHTDGGLQSGEQPILQCSLVLTSVFHALETSAAHSLKDTMQAH